MELKESNQEQITNPASLCTLRKAGSLDLLSAHFKAKTTYVDPKITCYCCTLQTDINMMIKIVSKTCINKFIF